MLLLTLSATLVAGGLLAVGPSDNAPPRILVYAVGDGLNAGTAMTLEDPIAQAVDSAGAEGIVGTSSKVEIGELPMDCESPGACPDRLADAVGAKLILFCSRQATEQVIRLELRAPRSAAAIAISSVRDVGASSLAAEATAVVKEMIAAIPPRAVAPIPEPAAPPPTTTASPPMVAPPPSTTLHATGPATARPPAPAPRVHHAILPPDDDPLALIPSKAPFWLGVATTGIALASAIIYSAQFSIQENRYESLARDGGTVTGDEMLKLEAQINLSANVGNALWITSAALAAGTIVIAILTDWSGRLRAAPVVQAGGGGAALAIDF